MYTAGADYHVFSHTRLQVAHAPLAVASVFLTFIVATAVPVVRGVPRKGNSIFSSDAEIINGRYGGFELAPELVRPLSRVAVACKCSDLYDCSQS